MLLARKMVILAKIETGYGTDPTPTGAANAILAQNVNINPLEVISAERKGIQHYLGNHQAIVAGKTVTLDFEVEIAGAGTAALAAGTPPAYGPLLRGCAMSETISTGTNAIYKPVSTGFESLTLYFNVDGVLHKLLGARGTYSMKFDAASIPVMAFKFTGLYSIPTDTALPVPTLAAFQEPVAMNNANTTPFAIHGLSAVLASLSVDIANQVAYRNLVGEEMVLITDRQPAGSVTIEATTVAAFDPWSKVVNATLGTAAITHGTSAGNKFKVDLGKVQLEKPAYSEQDGVQMLQLGLSVNPTTAGNDEIQITVF